MRSKFAAIAVTFIAWAFCALAIFLAFSFIAHGFGWLSSDAGAVGRTFFVVAQAFAAAALVVVVAELSQERRNG